MIKEFVNLGNTCRVPGQHIRSIIGTESEPIRRKIKWFRETDRLIDATRGRKARSLVITTCGHAYLSILMPDTIENRAIDNSE